jgi:hypothetical protein
MWAKVLNIHFSIQVCAKRRFFQCEGGYVGHAKLLKIDFKIQIRAKRRFLDLAMFAMGQDI